MKGPTMIPILSFRPEYPPVIIYHDHCLDGFTAAFVAHEALLRLGDAPDLVPDSYSTGLCSKPVAEWPISVEGRDIYIVDFSYPPAVLRELCLLACHVTVIDHHESAIAKIKNAFPDSDSMPDNLSLLLDTSLSGAGLAWQYFNPFEAFPMLVYLVQDRDLWKFDFKDTKSFCAGIGQYEKTLENWRTFLDLDVVDKLIIEGQTLLRSQESQMRSLIKNVRECIIAGHVVPVINCPGFLASELGNKVMKELKAPFSVTYFDGPTHRQWSLRSTDYSVNVKDIAEANGGGGHRNAAGFVTALGYSFPPYTGPV